VNTDRQHGELHPDHTQTDIHGANAETWHTEVNC